MQGDKIRQLNFAISETLPAMQDVARENPNAEVLVRAVTFASGAQWHVSTPTPVATFRWSDVHAGGVTDMGKALRLVAEQLRVPPMSERALPPVLVLVSDGQATDDFSSGLRALLAERWGAKAVRLAIAIGRDADLDMLSRFIGSTELKPLVASNSPTLVSFIRWASTAVLQAASAPSTQIGPAGSSHAATPVPPQPDHTVTAVW